MKKYSFSFFILCLSILCTQTVFTQTQTPSLLTQASESTKDTGTQTQSEVINPSDSREIFDQLKNSCNRLSTTIEQLEYQFRSEEFIKHRITIVELNELIERVQEDMKTRFALLNRSDKAEILKVIKEKEEALLKHLLDMETYLNPELYANKKKSSVKKIILTTCGITAAAVFLICLYIASVDTDQNCWTRPTFARFRSNLAALFNHQAPTQQPTAAAEPPAQQPPAPVLPPVSDTPPMVVAEPMVSETIPHEEPPLSPALSLEGPVPPVSEPHSTDQQPPVITTTTVNPQVQPTATPHDEAPAQPTHETPSISHLEPTIPPVEPTTASAPTQPAPTAAETPISHSTRAWYNPMRYVRGATY